MDLENSFYKLKDSSCNNVFTATILLIFLVYNCINSGSDTSTYFTHIYVEGEYLNKKRFDYAVSLLISTDYKVYDVAEQRWIS
mgnify:CR=1 FL=1